MCNIVLSTKIDARTRITKRPLYRLKREMCDSYLLPLCYLLWRWHKCIGVHKVSIDSYHCHFFISCLLTMFICYFLFFSGDVISKLTYYTRVSVLKMRMSEAVGYRLSVGIWSKTLFLLRIPLEMNSSNCLRRLHPVLFWSLTNFRLSLLISYEVVITHLICMFYFSKFRNW